MNLSSPTLAAAVGWSSLVLAILFALMGLVIAWIHRNDKVPEPQQPKPGEQGLKEIIDSTATFAKALKDLDRAAQLWTLAVLFMGVAGLVAGLDSVAAAVKSATS